MNTHKNARLTFARRLELVRDVLERGLTLCAAAAAHKVSVPSARKWVGRYLAEGQAGLADRSSRPKASPRAIAPSKALAIMKLRRRRLVQGRIAASLGLSKLRDLAPSEPPLPYEHAQPGDLVHIDTKKLGRIERMGHRITGNRRDSVQGAGWEFLFVAIDDRTRIGFTELYADERKRSAVQFLNNTVTYFASLGVRVRRVVTDNGSAFRSRAFARACRRLALKHRSETTS